jgi:aarF domain-containing kinase
MALNRSVLRVGGILRPRLWPPCKAQTLRRSSRRPLHRLRTQYVSPRFLSPRFLLLSVPLCVGALAFFPPTEPSPVPVILSCPSVIPCSASELKAASSYDTHQISSPIEARYFIIRRILSWLRDRIWEPLRTSARFIHLVILFAPVLITTPMLLLGSRTKRRDGQPWGAIWWYGLLVAQMQRAGPTFIKVRTITQIVNSFTQQYNCPARTMGCNTARLVSLRPLRAIWFPTFAGDAAFYSSH